MANRKKLRVNSIQRFCVQDGPGIRTTVFVQGCTLRCWWCHNAAMQPVSDEGIVRNIDDLANELERDVRYWQRSGGGVTLSGGEPLCQSEECAELLSVLGRRGHHRCVETAGSTSIESVDVLDEHVDLWLFDLKSMDPKTFSQGTGGDFTIMIANLKNILQKRSDSVWIRIPLIKGFNDDKKNLIDMKEFLSEYPDTARIQILPGHRLGGPYHRDPTVDLSTCGKAKEILSQGNSNVEACW